MYGSILTSVTLSPRASSKAPMDADATPLPSDDTTPPVTKMNLVFAVLFMAPAPPAWLALARAAPAPPAERARARRGAAARRAGRRTCRCAAGRTAGRTDGPRRDRGESG